MIWDSARWRASLTKDADHISKLVTLQPTSHRAYVLERKTFLTAFAIRKLIEARKIKDECLSYSIIADTYNAIGTPAFINWHRLESFFDLDAPSDRHISTTELINLLIHSYIFTLECNEKGDQIIGFFVASDRTRARELLRVRFSDYTDLCRRIANSWPSNSTWRRNDNGTESIKVW